MIAAKNREPAEQDYFEREVRPLLGGNVEFVGEVGGIEKLRLLGGARALLNPITWPEPFGLVMIEALACGTPVLAFPHGSAPEIVDHGVTGFLCRDAEEMESAVGRIDELDRWDCRRAAKQSFTTERMVHEHLELYDAAARWKGASAIGAPGPDREPRPEVGSRPGNRGPAPGMMDPERRTFADGR